MKLFKFFQQNKYAYKDYQYEHYQFLILKNITFLHLMFEVDKPCPYTGIRILTSFFDPTSLFGAELQVKGYSWSFWFFSKYWVD